MDKSQNYKKEGLIGEGSFGKVYKGIKLDTGEIVALKYISKKANEKEHDFETKLRRECDIHSGLNHRNIIRMLDYFDSEKDFVIVTELAKETLADLIQPGLPLPGYEHVRKIACDITSALCYLHSKSILHRDLKPHNVLIGKDNLAKVCDFGFARSMPTNQYLLTSYKGTPLYMAPEIIRPEGYDQLADVWSMGCIIYELITGKPPFPANSLFELYHIIMKPIKWDKRIKGDCLNFLLHVLKTKPSERLGWTSEPKILDHPYVADGVFVGREAGGGLTKCLSPSQEFAKETQRKHIQKLVYQNALYFPFPAQMKGHKLPKFHGTPASNLVVRRRHAILLNNNTNPSSHTNTPLVKLQQENGMLDAENNVLNGEAGNYRDNDTSSNSSVDTLTSSSDDESEDERATIIVEESRSSGNASHDDRTQNFHSNRPQIDEWISGTMVKTDTAVQDNPLETEEWLAYLDVNIKEVLEKPKTLCEKYTFRLIVQPLRNQFTGVVVVEKIASLLSLPFVLDKTKEDKSFIRDLETVYLGSKVLANLIYASKVIVAKRKLEMNPLESNSLVDVLTDEDLKAMDKCLRLVCFLIYSESEERFILQFCDSILGFQAYILFKLFLKLDGRCERLASYTLAILCHLMRTLPTNFSILEDIFLDDDGDELWRLISHKNSSIQSTALRILGYFLVHSLKARDVFLSTNSRKLWSILRNANAKYDSRVVEAAKFARDRIKQLDCPIQVPPELMQHKSLPLQF